MLAPQMRNSYEFRLVQVPSYFGRAVRLCQQLWSGIHGRPSQLNGIKTADRVDQ